MSAVLTEERETTDTGSDETAEDWWCVKVDPFEMMGLTHHYVSAIMDGKDGIYAAVIVWPERDHEELLRCAALAQKRERNPEIVEFKERFGKWINWDNFVLSGGKIE
jgi:hypothetical protein